MRNKLRFEKTENKAGLKNPKLPILKSSNFEVIDIAVTGDAPKEFIRAYFFGESNKASKSKWKKYIAKTGHKWYPNESIMEYLISRLGETIGLKMASSRLVSCSGQIRYLSQYFLDNGMELVHGADIYAGYMSDKEFILKIEEEGKARDFFTIQFTRDSFRHLFPENFEKIGEEFLKMVFFDAIVGNNDRHFYNWGVIRNIEEDGSEPCFSPIYDTARGLFWNFPEEKVVSLYKDLKGRSAKVEKYTNLSLPKLGWDGAANINHFTLVENIIKEDESYELLKSLVREENLQKCIKVIDNEFQSLLGSERLLLIKDCLSKRFEKLNSLLL